MAHEIERKYLVMVPEFRRIASNSPSFEIAQGYIHSSASGTSRVRIAGERAFLTIKGPVKGFSRLEFEYEIPLADAREMLANLCGGVVEKRRYLVDYCGHTWEVDEFYGENAGLFIAEIELGSESESYALPPFIGREVTGNRAFYNGSLARFPFSQWRDKVPEYRDYE